MLGMSAALIAGEKQLPVVAKLVAETDLAIGATNAVCLPETAWNAT